MKHSSRNRFSLDLNGGSISTQRKLLSIARSFRGVGYAKVGYETGSTLNLSILDFIGFDQLHIFRIKPIHISL